MRFGAPTMLGWLVLVPALALFLVWAFRARRRALHALAAAPLAEKLTTAVNRPARRWQAVLLVGTVFCAVVAGAQIGRAHV